MNKKRPKLKIKDRDASEQKLMEAAEEQFSKHGFDGATTRDIAQRAGVNLALIARYFDGKYGLLLAVLERKVDETQAMSLGEVKASLSEEVLAYVEFKFSQVTKNLDFFRIVIGQFVTDDKFLRRFHETMPLKFENPDLVERLENLVENKKVKAHFDVSLFIDTIERNTISIILFDVIMNRVSKEEAVAKLRSFVKEYSSLFEI